jgi:MFS family permease
MFHPTPRIVALLLAISSLPVMSNATISPALTGLAETFSDTPRIEILAGLVLSLPSIGIVLTAAAFGALLDRVSWKPVLFAALVLYAFGGAAAAFMDGMPGILASRMVLGLAAAGIMTTVSMLAAQLFEGSTREQFMGWQAGAMSGAGIIFILAGGALAGVSWRAPFLVYFTALPFALAAIWMFRPVPARFLSERSDTPLKLPIATLAVTGSMGFLTMMTFYLVPTTLPFHMRDLGITAPSAVAFAVAGVTLTATPGAIFFGAMRARLSAAVIFALSFGIMAVGYAVIASAPGFTQILIGTLFVGLGVGPSLPNVMALVMAKTTPQMRGKAAGFATTTFFAGQFTAPLAAGLISGPFGLTATFWVFAGFLVVLSGLSVLAATRPAAAA